MERQIVQEVTNFINKCEEIRKCKFIMAPTKIKDLLKCIVNSAELHHLFETVTKNFDYLAAKSKCFVTTTDGLVNRSYIVLPETIGDRLAFIFCLFVEFDRDSINFNSFLRKYFYEDGSYYASYKSFCDTIVVSLERLISDIYANDIAASRKASEELAAAKAAEAAAFNETARILSSISLSIAREKQNIYDSALPNEDKESGMNILTELEKALKAGNAKLVEALACGYNYYVSYNNIVSNGTSTLLGLINEYGALKNGTK